jgi:hypothetical protein
MLHEQPSPKEEARRVNQPLQVLLVEDSQADAELVLLELRRGGYEPMAQRVDTARTMQEALIGRDGTW